MWRPPVREIALTAVRARAGCRLLRLALGTLGVCQAALSAPRGRSRLPAELRQPSLRRFYWPLYRLWRQAALETENKARTWVDTSAARAHGTMSATRSTPPLDLIAFRDLTENDYRLYAGVFLLGPCCDTAVGKPTTSSGCPGTRPSPAPTPAATPSPCCAARACQPPPTSTTHASATRRRSRGRGPAWEWP